MERLKVLQVLQNIVSVKIKIISASTIVDLLLLGYINRKLKQRRIPKNFMTCETSCPTRLMI